MIDLQMSEKKAEMKGAQVVVFRCRSSRGTCIKLRLKRQGCIHSDFQQGGIVAEAVAYEGFVRYEGAKGAKAAGKWRVERKDYITHDGDVISFQFDF
jgi:hypothetical protein